MQHKHFISLLFVLFNYAVINFVTHTATHVWRSPHTHTHTVIRTVTRKDKDNCAESKKKVEEVERARRGDTQDEQEAD